jgi:hypothetical protein
MKEYPLEEAVTMAQGLMDRVRLSFEELGVHSYV